MARPREFDEVQVLDAAVQRFWEHGYEATSVRDLSDAMGITGASLYNAFGDKRSLYHKALDHYVGQSFGDRVTRFEGVLPPREAIGAFLNEIVERSLSDPRHKGCMLINSALELAPHDPEFQRAIASVLVRVEDFFRRCVEAGQREGTVSDRVPADDLARQLLATMVGVRVLSRARPEPELLRGIVRSALALLDGDPGGNARHGKTPRRPETAAARRAQRKHPT